MPRSERLFNLLQALRRHRHPVAGKILADEIGVSIRTLYRDIVSLQTLGATIEGEPGVGYILKPGFTLPPLMFTPLEIEALVLGSRWVVDRTDEPLRDAAHSALARIAAVLPIDLQYELNASTLLIGPAATIAADRVNLALLRRSVRSERKLALVYSNGSSAASERIVWPFALAFFDSVRVLLGWCELRQDFRHFRTDRIVSVTMTETRYPKRRQALLKEWRDAEGITKPLN